MAWYSTKLDTHPLLTKSISSGLIAGGGDFLCQICFERSQHKYDWARTGRFTVLGTAVVAPFVHAWFSFLNRMIPGVSVAAVLKRVAVDQLTFSPCFMSIWLTSLWTLEGDLNDGIPGRLVESMPSLMVVNWGLWIPAQLINFRFVPVKFQVLYSNVVALVWNMYLSYSQTRKQFHVE